MFSDSELMKRLLLPAIYLMLGFIAVAVTSCQDDSRQSPETKPSAEELSSVEAHRTPDVLPGATFPSLTNWAILLGNGDHHEDLMEVQHEDYFYTVKDESDWMVFKAPNGGITSPNSHNTRSELSQKDRWVPAEGGNMTGTLKVMHVSTNGDARVAASFSVVVGQIHSDDGHENEPLKIFYKKFPGHDKGSVYWNYEINTEGDNGKRWDYSTAVWGHDMSVVGEESDSYPAEPEDGIELGEEFHYEVNVYEGIMYLTFTSEGHEPKSFTKNLISTDYLTKADIPQQIIDLYSVIGRDGTEKPDAYTGERQFFKQGAYNQTNGRVPETNMVWSTGSETYEGDLYLQYENGSYTEVWFRESSVGPARKPE